MATSDDDETTVELHMKEGKKRHVPPSVKYCAVACCAIAVIAVVVIPIVVGQDGSPWQSPSPSP